MKNIKSNIIVAVPVVIVLLSLILLLGRDKEVTQETMIGIVETTNVDIASEIPGRIQMMHVDRGDIVKKGQVVATLKPNVVDAKVGQAKGVLEAAKSMMDMAESGARIEEKKAAKNKYEMAKSQFEFAKKTYDRFKNLYADSVISKQQLDEIQFKHDAAKEQMNAAKSLYDMARRGARTEQIQAAKGKYLQASNVYNEAVAFQEQLQIISYVDGEISNKIAERGEVVPAGYPVFSVQIPEEAYVILQVREDKLSAFKKGNKFKMQIPALDNQEEEFEVTFISPMADFATWVPTNQKGGFDLRTFEVHLKPQKAIKDLRPGMTTHLYL